MEAYQAVAVNTPAILRKLEKIPYNPLILLVLLQSTRHFTINTISSASSSSLFTVPFNQSNQHNAKFTKKPRMQE